MFTGRNPSRVSKFFACNMFQTYKINFNQGWIVATCVETYYIQIVSGNFWNWLCWMRSFISYDECTEKNYEEIKTDWEGKLYCDITMKWNYTKSYVDIAMPIYIK